MINTMRWHHNINAIKYQCTNYNINNVVIEKRSKSIILSLLLVYHYSNSFSLAVNCFKA